MLIVSGESPRPLALSKSTRENKTSKLKRANEVYYCTLLLSLLMLSLLLIYIFFQFFLADEVAHKCVITY